MLLLLSVITRRKAGVFNHRLSPAALLWCQLCKKNIYICKKKKTQIKYEDKEALSENTHKQNLDGCAEKHNVDD